MDRNQILAAIQAHRRGRTSSYKSEILYIRGCRIWWLHWNNHGEVIIELSEYGVN